MWYPVKGYEGFYEITADGRVRNAKGVELKPFIQSFAGTSSKPRINLYRDGEATRHFVHILIKQSIPA
jgi:hypothetical protein